MENFAQKLKEKVKAEEERIKEEIRVSKDEAY